jgi:hypothetical protein
MRSHTERTEAMRPPSQIAERDPVIVRGDGVCAAALVGCAENDRGPQ